jgi:hypothetical protein
VRRAQDTIKPHSGHNDIMVLANEDNAGCESHPFWYARVIGVFHANVLPFNIPGGPKLSVETRMDFLWVRWFVMESSINQTSNFKEQKLDRVRFLDAQDPNAFGFVDPRLVIRGCHVIPAFSRRRTTKYLTSTSVARPEDSDWDSFYVSR